MAGVKSLKGDLTVLSEAISSIKGSSIVFLCVGLPYDHKIWERTWPRIMKHTIEACIRTNSKLIFFDNVYMYGQVKGVMTSK